MCGTLAIIIQQSEVLVVLFGETIVVLIEVILLDYFISFETLQIFLLNVGLFLQLFLQLLLLLVLLVTHVVQLNQTDFTSFSMRS